MALGARPFYLVLTVFLFSQVITNLWPRHYLQQQPQQQLQHQHRNSVLSSWMSKRSLDEPNIQVHVTPLAHLFVFLFFFSFFLLALNVHYFYDRETTRQDNRRRILSLSLQKKKEEIARLTTLLNYTTVYLTIVPRRLGTPRQMRICEGVLQRLSCRADQLPALLLL